MPNLTKYQRRRWNHTIKELKRRLPCHYPVSIRITNCENSGLYWREGRKLLINISRQQTYGQKLDALIHEYAHALDRADLKAASDEHNEAWGVYYAKCYKVVVDCCFEIFDKRPTYYYSPWE